MCITVTENKVIYRDRRSSKTTKLELSGLDDLSMMQYIALAIKRDNRPIVQMGTEGE